MQNHYITTNTELGLKRTSVFKGKIALAGKGMGKFLSLFFCQIHLPLPPCRYTGEHLPGTKK